MENGHKLKIKKTFCCFYFKIVSFVVIFVAVAPTVDVPQGEMLRSCGVGTGVSVSRSVPEQRSGAAFR